MSWSDELVKDYMAEYHKKMGSFGVGSELVDDEPDPGPEKVLQNKILKWCKQRGYPVFHDNSRRKNIAGWPDLTIVMEDSKVLFVELKSAGGKLRKEQQHLKQVFHWLKHEIHVVKSFKRFLEIVS